MFRKICNFIQGNGAFNSVTCRYGFQERVWGWGGRSVNTTNINKNFKTSRHLWTFLPEPGTFCPTMKTTAPMTPHYFEMSTNPDESAPANFHTLQKSWNIELREELQSWRQLSGASLPQTAALVQTVIWSVVNVKVQLIPALWCSTSSRWSRIPIIQPQLLAWRRGTPPVPNKIKGSNTHTHTQISCMYLHVGSCNVFFRSIIFSRSGSRTVDMSLFLKVTQLMMDGPV